MSLIDRCISDLQRHEGFRAFPYKDSVGILTIGYGRNLESRGITSTEADVMLRNDVLLTVDKLSDLDFWLSLSERRQSVLVNMAFNMGYIGLMTFKGMFEAIRAKDWNRAADEMLRSRWAAQVKGRAVELAEAMRNG